MTKTTHEALGIPTKEANAQGIRATKQVLNMLSDQVYPENPLLAEEREVILRETRLILDKTRELGEGDWAVGAVRAFAAGVIDVPFAPSSFNAGRLCRTRQSGRSSLLSRGICRSQDISFHRASWQEKAEQRTPNFQMVSMIFMPLVKAVDWPSSLGDDEFDRIENLIPNCHFWIGRLASFHAGLDRDPHKCCTWPTDQDHITSDPASLLPSACCEERLTLYDRSNIDSCDIVNYWYMEVAAKPHGLELSHC